MNNIISHFKKSDHLLSKSWCGKVTEQEELFFTEKIENVTCEKCKENYKHFLKDELSKIQ